MLKLTKTGIGLLTRQYRSVLKKCWMINVGVFSILGNVLKNMANTFGKMTNVPSAEPFTSPSEGTLNAFNVSDDLSANHISISRLLKYGLLSTTILGAAIMPSEAEAASKTGVGVLCYSGNNVYYYPNSDTCDTGTQIASLGLATATSTSNPVGSYSLALGSGARAAGNYSTAMGYYAKATGESSTALGRASATGGFSTAMGYYANATGGNSTALGYYAKAYGYGSSAFGLGSVAGLDSDDTIDPDTGATTTSVERYAMAMGYYANATGKYSTAIGYESVADEDNTVSVGRFGADSATLAAMKADLDGGMSESDFVTKYAQYSEAKLDDLYVDYAIRHADWETSVRWSDVEEIYRRITNVADGVNEHDAATKGQLDTALNNYYTKYGFGGDNEFLKNSLKYKIMHKNIIKSSMLAIFT